MATERKNATMAQRWVDGKLETTIIGASGGDAVIVFDPNKASAANRARAMGFGWQQRLADAGAIESTDKDGNPIPAPQRADRRLARITALRDHYESGSDVWEVRARAEGGVDAGLTILAMIRAGFAADVEAANGMIERGAAKRGIERAAMLRVWAGADKIVAAVAAIKAERSTVDADDLAAECAEQA